jgi:hypothetical protein
MLHRCRDVVFREEKRYTPLNAADDAILNKHFYRDVIMQSTPTKKQSETSQSMEKPPTGDGNSERQTEEPLDNDSPPDPPKPNKKSRELASLESPLGDAWKPPAEGSRQSRSGKDTLAESAQLPLEVEEFEDMIHI